MECPNCSFQNTPGLGSCVRCQSVLDLGGVGFTPPRASRSAVVRLAREVSRSARMRLHDATDALAAALAAALARRVPREVPTSEVLASVIPGMGQVLAGRRGVGWTLFGTWALSLLLALLNLGSPAGLLLVFGAVGVHCTAVSLILSPVQAGMSTTARAAAGLVTWAILVGGLYWPLSLLGRQLFTTVYITGIVQSPILRNDDVLIATGEWTGPKSFAPGDVIVYHIPRVTGSGVMVAEGLGVDRILAGPGDTMQVENGELTINGRPVPGEQRPLGQMAKLSDVSVTAGSGEYIVLPSLLPMATHGHNAPVSAMISRVSRVNTSQIVGRVVCRIRPWSRFTPAIGAQPP